MCDCAVLWALCPLLMCVYETKQVKHSMSVLWKQAITMWELPKHLER
mgnify:CR=1 FL=1